MNQPAAISPLGEFPTSQGVTIDIKRIIYQALRYWYFIVLSLFVCLTIAYLKNRYATRIYPVTASIIIQENDKGTEGSLLYNNPIVSGFRNYLNELYIIKSYPLIEVTIDELNFETSFYRVGNFLTTEAYKYFPLEVNVIDDFNLGGRQFYFEVINGQQFKLTQNGGEKVGKMAALFNFNDTVVFEKMKVVFEKQSGADLSLFKNESLLFSYTPVASLTGAYVGKLNATWAEEGAGVINLSVNGSDAVKEIDFLNGLIDQYQTYDLLKKNQAASRTIDFITGQLNSITDSLRDAERQLEVFKNKNVITNLGGEAQRLYERIENLEVQKTEMIIRENYFKYLTDYIAMGEGLDQIILPSSVGINDGILSKLISDMIDSQTQIKMYMGKGNIQNPFVLERKNQIEDIRNNIIESIKNQKAIDKIKMDFLNKGIAAIDKQMRSLPLAERQLVSIQRNYTLLENLYVFLLQKRAEAGISKASTTSDIVVVNPPMQSGSAISPKIQQNYLFAAVIGLGLPLLLFVLLEVINNRVQSREDIEKISTIPFIGGIGHKKGDINLEVIKSPKSSIAESFRALRSNLNYFTGNKDKAVFMITSSISGEGKTFTSINLASVLALSGQKVLIVGADLRKPKLFMDFGLTNTIGLSTYLSGRDTFESVIQKTNHENLYLVSGGPVPPNPSELLLNKKMEEFLRMAKEKYDYIILDTPPIAIVTDAFALADFADHTLFLVRQNYTPKILLKNIEDFHRSGKLKNISIVLNDIYKSGPGYGYGYGYGGYGYGYGYGYGSKKNGYGYYSES